MANTIYCFSGRMKYYEEMTHVASLIQAELVCACIVPFKVSDDTIPVAYNQELLQCHFDKIRISDALIVIGPNSEYGKRDLDINRDTIGKNTYQEILFARSIKKPIYYTKMPVFTDKSKSVKKVKLSDNIVLYQEISE